ncbi:hypothetical protein [Nonomuraea jabiensis]|uniref:Lambda repressor-like predicted transcriptional regulator n=1 Tax=Nonomuraea jabiensis TaxID=882448 RepID=A0A7W9LFF9_9ACTN|nr:hypothetical protein [Nonomuraea jabiensis]MBB5781855.1 lambda repressor-like predicted transcriptional regulator [Nonomuraea jabiensis]
MRATFRDEGASIAGLARERGVSRGAVRTVLADLLPDPRIPPPLTEEDAAAR